MVVKEAMNLIRKPAGPAKPPVANLDQKGIEKLRNILKDLSVLESE
jgi:hypothetical protein